jgi:hypothetical protein
MIFASVEQEHQFGARLVRRILRNSGIAEQQLTNYLELIAKGEPQLAALRRSISVLTRTGVKDQQTTTRIQELKRQKLATERELQCSIFNLLFDTGIYVPSEELPELFDMESLRQLERTQAEDPNRYSEELEKLKAEQIRVQRQLRLLLYAYSIDGSYSEQEKRDRIHQSYACIHQIEAVLIMIDLLQLEMVSPQH